MARFPDVLRTLAQPYRRFELATGWGPVRVAAGPLRLHYSLAPPTVAHGAPRRRPAPVAAGGAAMSGQGLHWGAWVLALTLGCSAWHARRNGDSERDVRALWLGSGACGVLGAVLAVLAHAAG